MGSTFSETLPNPLQLFFFIASARSTCCYPIFTRSTCFRELKCISCREIFCVYVTILTEEGCVSIGILDRFLSETMSIYFWLSILGENELAIVFLLQKSSNPGWWYSYQGDWPLTQNITSLTEELPSVFFGWWVLWWLLSATLRILRQIKKTNIGSTEAKAMTEALKLHKEIQSKWNVKKRPEE